jgi:predicted enzyme related to lactoylglutathione lyase
MKLGVSFYYVGNVQEATAAYSRLFATSPVYADEDWVRFHLEGGDLALHMASGLPRTKAVEPVRFGAVVSISVDDIHTFLRLAADCGFAQVGEVQGQAYGFQAEVRDPWGNRLSILQPK